MRPLFGILPTNRRSGARGAGGAQALKGSKLSGARGNGIEVVFVAESIDLDSPTYELGVEAVYDEENKVLTITVEDGDREWTPVKWSQVQDAIKLIDYSGSFDGYYNFGNCFSLIAKDQEVEVGLDTIEDFEGTIDNGVNGGLAPSGELFAVGNRETRGLAVGGKLHAIWDDELQEWVPINLSARRYGYTTESIAGATGPATGQASFGEFQPVFDDGTPDGEPVQIRNRYKSGIGTRAPGYVESIGGVNEAANFDCKTWTEAEIEPEGEDE